jgi:hypothetical protein
MRKPCTFRQRDVEVALRAAAKVGLLVSGYEIGKDGKIIVHTGKPGEQLLAGDKLQEELGKWSP